MGAYFSGLLGCITMKLKVKPLSVNEVWQGRRYKTDTYKTYETLLLYMLPKTIYTNLGDKLRLKICFGMSSKASDIDNPVKPFIDILSKKYGFNDKNIYKLEVEKRITEKEQEYIEFEIKKV